MWTLQNQVSKLWLETINSTLIPSYSRSDSVVMRYYGSDTKVKISDEDEDPERSGPYIPKKLLIEFKSLLRNLILEYSFK